MTRGPPPGPRAGGPPRASTRRYYVVDRLSPVSTSVANTLKRSLLIVLTILYFGNEMTAESVGGVSAAARQRW